MIVEKQQRRQHPRLRCFGTSLIMLPMGRPAVEAAIVDLSVAGCRLLTKVAVPLEAGTVIELTFQINQLPFRVRACLQAPRSPVELGFAFVDLSTRSRHRIEDLVEELAEDQLRQARASRNRTAASWLYSS